MEGKAAGTPALTVLESVCCLECGSVYAKPSDGGTVRRNPGCPECGYVGWARLGLEVSRELLQRHSVGGPTQGPAR